MLRKRSRAVVGTAAVLLLVAVFLAGRYQGLHEVLRGNSLGTVESPAVLPASSAPAAAAAGIVGWSAALDHAGEEVTVEGPVVGTYYARSSNGGPTFLNLGRDYPDPDRFTVVIWERDRDRFAEAPEVIYRGRTIRVTGVVAVYKGSPQIEVQRPEQIEVVE